MKKFLLFAAAALVASSASAKWVSIIEGGNAADGTSASFQAGWAGDAQVVDNPKGDGKVFEAPIAADPTNAWDSQFFIVFNEALQEDDVYKVSFDYYCTDSRKVDMQTQQAPGEYLHWTIGIPSLEVKPQWQSVNSGEVTVSAQMATGEKGEGTGFKVIAFNLASAPEAATFYINNIVVEKFVEGEDEPGDEPAGKILDVLPNLSNEAYDAATKTITFGEAWGWVNWWYGDNGDFSEYDSFVIEFEPVDYTVQLAIQYAEGDMETVAVPSGESKIVAPLDPERKNAIKQIAIQNSDPGTLTLKAAYFEGASAGVKAISGTVANTAVYNMQGVKVANSIDEVAAPGLYITNGKKIIKK